MYEILLYENQNGESEINDYLMDLAKRAITNKEARIHFKQITLYIELLKNHGTRLPSNITKHIVDDIWELRPGNNRVLYFYFKDNKFVLLHIFRKKTQQTPKGEIEKAIKESKDYIKRNGGR